MGTVIQKDGKLLALDQTETFACKRVVVVKTSENTLINLVTTSRCPDLNERLDQIQKSGDTVLGAGKTESGRQVIVHGHARKREYKRTDLDENILYGIEEEIDPFPIDRLLDNGFEKIVVMSVSFPHGYMLEGSHLGLIFQANGAAKLAAFQSLKDQLDKCKKEDWYEHLVKNYKKPPESIFGKL